MYTLLLCYGMLSGVEAIHIYVGTMISVTTCYAEATADRLVNEQQGSFSVPCPYNSMAAWIAFNSDFLLTRSKNGDTCLPGLSTSCKDSLTQAGPSSYRFYSNSDDQRSHMLQQQPSSLLIRQQCAKVLANLALTPNMLAHPGPPWNHNQL